MTITFCLIPSISLGVLREWSGFDHFPYSILNYDNKLWGPPGPGAPGGLLHGGPYFI